MLLSGLCKRDKSGERGFVMSKYTVSQEPKSGMWYCHLEGFPYVPCFGSFCEKKSEAREYAKMHNGLLHKVNEIERRRKKKNGTE